MTGHGVNRVCACFTNSCSLRFRIADSARRPPFKKMIFKKNHQWSFFSCFLYTIIFILREESVLETGKDLGSIAFSYRHMVTWYPSKWRGRLRVMLKLQAGLACLACKLYLWHAAAGTRCANTRSYS